MDSITQAALGAAIGQATLGKKVGMKGIVAGAVVATIPDLDVALRLFYSSYDMLRIHRGISHSLVFGVVGALAVAFIMQRIKPFRGLSLLRLWSFSALCLITHSLLDYCTAYGTQLLLPFSDACLGLDTVNVVDPVYTVPLLLGTFGGLYFPTVKYRLNGLGLLASTLYLGITLIAKQHVEAMLRTDLTMHNIESPELLTMPVGMAGVNWYGLASTADGIYMKKYSITGSEDDFTYFPKNEPVLNRLSPEVAATMRWFAKGFYTAEETGDTIRIYNLQVDMRGMRLNRVPMAPTKGFFQFVKQDDGTYSYGYGSF